MDKRERIIRAALKLFVEKGFHNTSTANISRAAGVAAGTLFLYFSTKDELINVLYKECKQELGRVLAEDLPLQEDSRGQLRHLWFKALEWVLENTEAFRFMGMFRHSPFITSLTREEAAAEAAFVTGIIERGIREGEIARRDMELIMLSIDGLLTATTNYLSLNPAKNKARLMESSFELLWKAIGA